MKNQHITLIHMKRESIQFSCCVNTATDTPNLIMEKGSLQALNDIFKLHRCVGAFPLVIEEEGCRINFTIFIGSVAILGITLINFTMVDEQLNIMLDTFEAKSFPFVYLVPYILLVSIAIVHLFWIVLNRRKMHKLFLAIKCVEMLTHNSTPKASRVPIAVMISAIWFGLIQEYLLMRERIKNNPALFICFASNCAVLFIICQFTAMLSVLGHHYGQLSSSLEPGNAEKMIECHEHITDCCDWLSHCYSPQIISISLLNFMYLTANTYLLVASHNNRIEHIVLCIYWNSFDILLNLYFVACCAKTKQKVRF